MVATHRLLKHAKRWSIGCTRRNVLADVFERLTRESSPVYGQIPWMFIHGSIAAYCSYRTSPLWCKTVTYWVSYKQWAGGHRRALNASTAYWCQYCSKSNVRILILSSQRDFLYISESFEPLFIRFHSSFILPILPLYTQVLSFYEAYVTYYYMTVIRIDSPCM